MKKVFLYLIIVSALLFCVSEHRIVSRAEQESESPSLSIQVSYEKLGDDGRLNALIQVSCDAEDGDSSSAEAKNVVLTIQGHEKIEFLEVSSDDSADIQPGSTYQVNFHNIENDQIVSCSVRLQIKGIDERKKSSAFKGILSEPDQDTHIYLDDQGEVIVPWLQITAKSDNYGSCEYRCDLDIAAQPRAILMGWNQNSDKAIQNDLNTMEDVYSKSFYNGLPVDIVLNEYNTDWNEIRERIETLDTDDNDITFFYVNAHGYKDLNTCISANHSGYRYTYDGVERDGSMVLSYDELVKTFSSIKGRVVIVLDSCFSGYAIDSAEKYFDTDRMAILTSVDKELYAGAYSSYGWFTHDISKLFYNSLAQMPVLELKKLITVNDAYLVESMRHIALVEYKVIGLIPIALSPFQTNEKKTELLLTGINPQKYGDASLPLFVKDQDYDDGKVMISVKNVSSSVMPPGENDMDQANENGNGELRQLLIGHYWLQYNNMTDMVIEFLEDGTCKEYWHESEAEFEYNESYVMNGKLTERDYYSGTYELNGGELTVVWMNTFNGQVIDTTRTYLFHAAGEPEESGDTAGHAHSWYQGDTYFYEKDYVRGEYRGFPDPKPAPPNFIGMLGEK